MISKLKKRWLRPRMLGVLLAKLILSGATDLAAQTVPTNAWENANNGTVQVAITLENQAPCGYRVGTQMR